MQVLERLRSGCTSLGTQRQTNLVKQIFVWACSVQRWRVALHHAGRPVPGAERLELSASPVLRSVCQAYQWLMFKIIPARTLACGELVQLFCGFSAQELSHLIIIVSPQARLHEHPQAAY